MTSFVPVRSHFSLPVRLDDTREAVDRTPDCIRIPQLPDLQVKNLPSGVAKTSRSHRRPLRRRQEEVPHEARVRRPFKVRRRDDKGRQVLRRPGGLLPRAVRLLRVLQVQESVLRR